MYNDKRTIQGNGLLSQKEPGAGYQFKPVSIKYNAVTKPAATSVNQDQDKAQYSSYQSAQYALQQQAQNSGGGGGGSVICTELKRLGIMSDELYEYAHLSRPVHPVILNGYHLWAVPYVEAMRKWSLPRVIASPFALAWAKQRAHKIAPDKFQSGSILGSAVHYLGGILCFIIGLLVPVKVAWQSLYTGNNQGYPWPTR